MATSSTSSSAGPHIVPAELPVVRTRHRVDLDRYGGHMPALPSGRDRRPTVSSDRSWRLGWGFLFARSDRGLVGASVRGVAVPARFRPALAGVVERLAALDYQGLKRDGIDPFPDSDLSVWIRNYGAAGATIVSLPGEAWAEGGAGPVAARPGQWWVVLPLWTREEGMSDLCLEATVTESPGGVMVVIDGIRVLLPGGVALAAGMPGRRVATARLGRIAPRRRCRRGGR
jgi:hypothetical protein